MRKIILLKPYGWCSGVKIAIKKFNSIKQRHSNCDIYILGNLIHNKNSLMQIKDTTTHFLNVKDQLLYLHKLNPFQSVIVFPAHGHLKNIYEFARKKFKYVYELTCPFIKKNINLINSLSKQNHRVFFFGDKNHTETKNILSSNESVRLVTSYNDVNKINEHAYLFNQSTYPTCLIDENITNKKVKCMKTTCIATNDRYKNILSLSSRVDLLLVVGDKNSFNTNMLCNLSKQKHTALIQSAKDLKKINFINVKICAITSGTSTSKSDVEKIINKLITYYKFEK